jgi:hypothetical protein
VFSNLVTDPIDYRSEACETEEGDGKLFVTGSDSTVAFDTAEEVLDSVAMSVEAMTEVVVDPPGTARRDADHRAGAGQVGSKVRGIKTLVGEHPFASHVSDERGTGVRIVGLAGSEREGYRTTEGIDHRGKLGIEPTLGAAHRLGRLAAGGIGSVLVDFDMRAIHAANPPVGVGCENRKKAGPQTRGAPTTESSVNRSPWSKLPRQVPPWNPRAKHIPDARNHGAVILGRSTATATICQIPFSGVVRSIFLAAPIAAPVTQNDL